MCPREIGQGRSLGQSLRFEVRQLSLNLVSDQFKKREKTSENRFLAVNSVSDTREEERKAPICRLKASRSREVAHTDALQPAQRLEVINRPLCLRLGMVISREITGF